MRLLLLAALALAATAQEPAEVRGIVMDARGGEPLSNVQVLLTGTAFRATTDGSGRFRITGVTPGDHILNASTVGYHLVKRPFHLDPGASQEFEVVLTPDTLRQTDTVQVKADPFETVRPDNPSALVLVGNDAKNLGSVLADDPLRAVQNLPGVTSNNDFDARFSLRGADFNRIGLYLDTILLHQPFHTLEGYNLQGSATAFNGDLVEEMELHQGGWPQRFENRTAGVLDVHTREGSSTVTRGQASASASNAGGMGEGPLGKHGSWLAGARKSYLQYIFARTFPETAYFFGFEDAQGRLTYDLTSKHSVSLYLLESYSDLNRENSSRLGINSLAGAGYHYSLSTLGWRYTASDRLLVSTHAAWMREKYDNLNPTGLPLGSGFYGEYTVNTAATWMWNARNPLDAGVMAHRLRDGGFDRRYDSVGGVQRIVNRFDGTGVAAGGFLQQAWNAFGGRLHLTAGLRWDRHSVDGVAALSPQASAAMMVTPTTRLHLAWGEYAQFPEIALFTSTLGSRALLPLRAIHVTAALEQRLGSRTRLRLEYYNRADRDLTFQSLYEPRLIANKVFVPPVNPPFRNSLRGYSRGFEVFVQRTSANRFTGWVSYAFGRTGMRDGISGSRFPADFDQRHTVNIYGGYRLRPSVNLSARLSVGSGFPIPGYFARNGAGYLLAAERNRVRLPTYSRADIRVNKSWTHDKWKLTLYGEVVNLFNRTNYIVDSYNGYNSNTRQAFITLDTMFPILPSAGVMFER
jgi:hypothetical protein